MSDQSTEQPETQLIEELKMALAHIPQSTLKHFKMQLFPTAAIPDIYQAILCNMALRIQANSSSGAPISVSVADIINKTRFYEPDLFNSLSKLFEKGFLDRLNAKINSFNSIPMENSKRYEKRNRQAIESFKIDLTKGKPEANSQKCQTSTKMESPKEEIDNVQKIAEGDCFCQKLLSPSEEHTFPCSNCGYWFHYECMKKNENSPVDQCLKCHLKLIIPNKPTIKQLFIGVLNKNIKRHEFVVKMDKLPTSTRQKVQLRCFRLKEATTSFILFPDYVSIELNDNFAKEFIPLHRQSSLKYRKDEPVTVDFKKLTKEIKVMISEDISKRDCREDRIERQNHLIGLFLVDDIPCEQLCQSIEKNCLTTFQQSLNLLNAAWKGNGGTNQEVSLEMIKIPLMCILTTERIKIPVRGIFCRHFQCFDLHNYVFLIAQAINPRWVCPLCRLPAYNLSVDCILSAILNDQSQDDQVKEVVFFRSGEYSIAKEQSQWEEGKHSINDLRVQSMRKRSSVTMGEEGSCGRNLGKKEVVISLLE